MIPTRHTRFYNIPFYGNFAADWQRLGSADDRYNQQQYRNRTNFNAPLPFLPHKQHLPGVQAPLVPYGARL